MNEKVLIDVSKLQKISNYARKIGKSVVWIYTLEKEKKIQIVKIDGVKFVKIP